MEAPLDFLKKEIGELSKQNTFFSPYKPILLHRKVSIITVGIVSMKRSTKCCSFDKIPLPKWRKSAYFDYL